MRPAKLYRLAILTIVAIAGGGRAGGSDLSEVVPAELPTGRVSGVVRLRGEPPRFPPVASAEGSILEPVPDESLVVDRAGGVANVFVWLVNPPTTGAASSPQDPARLLQLSYRFMPRAQVLRVGQPLRVINGDAVPLSLFVAGTRNPAVNFGIAAQDVDGALLESGMISMRAEPAPVPIRSNYHRFMRAYMLVVDHPHAAVTDAVGSFEIAGLPPGEYEFALWHERAGYLEQRLKVRVDEVRPARVQLEYALDRFLPGRPAAGLAPPAAN